MTDDDKAAAMAQAFHPLADLNRLPCTGPNPSDDAQHYILCMECGQAIDCRLLGDVCHHEMPGHERIPVS